LLIKFQGARRQTVHVLVMEARRMPTCHPQQARHGLFGNLHQTSGCSDPTAFPKMVDDIFRCALWQLGIE
jgi:hypothetical protein